LKLFYQKQNPLQYILLQRINLGASAAKMLAIRLHFYRRFSINFASQNRLPDREKYPNFSIELILGLTNAKTEKRWFIVY